MRLQIKAAITSRLRKVQLCFSPFLFSPSVPLHLQVKAAVLKCYGERGAEKDVLMVFLVQAEAEGAKGSLEKASSPCFSAEFLQAQKIMRLKQNLDKYCWLCAHL